MCGITGIFSPTGRIARQRRLIEAMTDRLRHRGPDDAGYFEDDAVSFGFRRLSIMDPQRGRQPFRDERLGLAWMVNGEIYNYPELKSWLEDRGHRFATGSDAEVIGALYAEKGTGFVEHLNGQFAVALWDSLQRTLLLARDPVGIAPLFYAPMADGLVFGSEIKSLIVHPELETGLDLKGLDQVMVFPGMVSPRTLFKGVASVKPGHLLRVREGEIVEQRYWDLVFPEEGALISGGGDGAREIQRLGEALERAVARRLQSDVPVGFYLSGGLDSALVASHIRESSRGGVQDAFSIVFADAAIDEGRYQRTMADHLGCRRHEIPFDWPDIAGRLPDAVWHGETALKESYNTCSLALSEAVGQQGIKVILTGEGADELFAGYVGYRMDLLRGADEHLEAGFENFLETEIRERLWGDPDFFYERAYAPFRELRQGLYAPDLQEAFVDFDATEFPVIDTQPLRNRHPLHKRAYIDFKLRLSDHLLADHGDRVAFANGVEARYPFLDPEVIEIARTLHPDLLIRDGAEKYPLRRHGQGRRIPPEILGRQKFAFVAPGSPFLVRRQVPWVMDLLSEDRIRRQGVFDAGAVNHLVRRCLDDPQFSVNTTFETDFLMIVLTFQMLSERFGRHLNL